MQQIASFLQILDALWTNFQFTRGISAISACRGQKFNLRKVSHKASESGKVLSWDDAATPFSRLENQKKITDSLQRTSRKLNKMTRGVRYAEKTSRKLDFVPSDDWR